MYGFFTFFSNWIMVLVGWEMKKEMTLLLMYNNNIRSALLSSKLKIEIGVEKKR